MFRRPPRSTLFPHTTLFQSENHTPVPMAEIQKADAERRQAINQLLTPQQGTQYARIQQRIDGLPSLGVRLLDFRQDRKSTRLNSSHTVISYAAFCFEKKKHI